MFSGEIDSFFGDLSLERKCYVTVLAVLGCMYSVDPTVSSRSPYSVTQFVFLSKFFSRKYMFLCFFEFDFDLSFL